MTQGEQPEHILARTFQRGFDALQVDVEFDFLLGLAHAAGVNLNEAGWRVVKLVAPDPGYDYVEVTEEWTP